MDRSLLNIVTVGHVDHGKSTVVGRLLADAGALPQGKLEAIRENCRRNAKPFEYAFLLDALKNEQAQGITIDTARCFFQTEKRDYILIDAPGHIEFLKNMVTGASRAEAALLVVDVSRGVEENTRRHGYFLKMLGIRQTAVLVNKMDLVAYDRAVFETVRTELSEFLERIGVVPESFIPVSGMQGDNIVRRSANMPWYDGVTMLEQTERFISPPSSDKRSFRMPIQGVYKFSGDSDDRRIVAGSVQSGTLREGDRLVFYPSGKQTAVKSLEVFHALRPECFTSDMAAGFTMTEEIFVRRGELVCREGEEPPCVGVRLRAHVFWLGRKPFDRSRRYMLKCGTAKLGMRLETVVQVLNASDLDCSYRGFCDRNEVCECILDLDEPMAFDLASVSEGTSRFVIVDEYEIAGGGIITERLQDDTYDRRNIRWSGSAVSPAERRRLLGREGLVVWMTGLSGAGKTTIAQEVERRLLERHIPAFVLDGDRLRRGLNRDLGFSDEDRRENIRRTAELASLMQQAGTVVLVTLISPFAASRAEAAEIVGDAFMEVWVKAGLDTCRSRDPKGLYKKALSGEIASFTGLTSPYEEPEHPGLILDTEVMDEAACVEALLEAISKKTEDRIL